MLVDIAKMLPAAMPAARQNAVNIAINVGNVFILLSPSSFALNALEEVFKVLVIPS